jgi:hypothetical protein
LHHRLVPAFYRPRPYVIAKPFISGVIYLVPVMLNIRTDSPLPREGLSPYTAPTVS